MKWPLIISSNSPVKRICTTRKSLLSEEHDLSITAQYSDSRMNAVQRACGIPILSVYPCIISFFQTNQCATIIEAEYILLYPLYITSFVNPRQLSTITLADKFDFHVNRDLQNKDRPKKYFSYLFLQKRTIFTCQLANISYTEPQKKRCTESGYRSQFNINGQYRRVNITVFDRF